MEGQTKPLVEITENAIRLLVRELGPADTLRFINRFTMGQGNYTEERDELFAQMTLDAFRTRSSAIDRPDRSARHVRYYSPRKIVSLDNITNLLYI